MVRRTPDNQLAFRFPAARRALADELVIDVFAGGGGASHGIEKALGRSPDYAINHDPDAIVMHTANHPSTEHLQEDVWKVRIRELVAGRPVGLLWASPDCRHFSRAKGGKPVSKSVRSLAWVVVEYAREVAPRVICLENVPEFLDWGPLDDQGCPIKARAGEEFNEWADALRGLGYEVEWKFLTASLYGAPTSRKRLFLVARRDGRPIRWPEPTHGPGTPYPVRTAAECIDWAIPCPSIFGRARDLAEATLRRVARGILRYVIEDEKPFLVTLTHGGRLEPADEPMRTVTGAHRGEKALVSPILAGCGGRAGQSEPRAGDAPMYTITKKADTCFVAPTLVQAGYGERRGQAPRALDIRKPLGTVVAGGAKHAACGAVLKFFGGVVGQPIEKPLGTITKVDHHGLVAGHMTKLYGTATGADLRKPMPTTTSGGQHLGLVAPHLTKFRTKSTGQPVDTPLHTITGGGGGACGHFGLISPHLTHYYSQGGQDQAMGAPMHTVPTRDRHALTEVGLGDHLPGAIRTARFMMKYGGYIPRTYVRIGRRYRAIIVLRIGEAFYLLTDIGLRMLQPRELATAQGFPIDYVLTGTKSVQVAKIGNSVCPPVAEAVVRANLVEAEAPMYAEVAA